MSCGSEGILFEMRRRLAASSDWNKNDLMLTEVCMKPCSTLMFALTWRAIQEDRCFDKSLAFTLANLKFHLILCRMVTNAAVYIKRLAISSTMSRSISLKSSNAPIRRFIFVFAPAGPNLRLARQRCRGKSLEIRRRGYHSI